MDYLRYWALNRKPFLFDRYDGFFAGPPQREALAGLSYFLASDQQLAMLNCPPQNGLSWIFSHLTQMRGFGDRATELITTRCDESEPERILAHLFRTLYHTLEFECPANPMDAERLERQIDSAMQALGQQGIHFVWLQDRNHPNAAKVAKLLANRHQNLSVVIGTNQHLAAQAVLKIGKYPMQIDLETLSLDDSIDFVRFGIERAGGNVAAIPDNSAVRLHEVTGGVIGRLAVAAETALALAANHQLDVVTPAVVEAAGECQRRAA